MHTSPPEWILIIVDILYTCTTVYTFLIGIFNLDHLETDFCLYNMQYDVLQIKQNVRFSLL